jgi:hypothetical protein
LRIEETSIVEMRMWWINIDIARILHSETDTFLKQTPDTVETNAVWFEVNIQNNKEFGK